MARKIGSKNRIKESSFCKIINLNKNIKNSPEINDKSTYDWVYWGKDNKYPLLLLDLYYNSITHHSCVDFLVNAVIGDGIDYNKMEKDESQLVPNMYDTWENFIKKITFDLVVFGSFSFQIIKNKDDKTYSFFHQAFSTVRLGKKDENGVIQKAYLSRDWTNIMQNKPIEIEVIKPGLEIKNSKPYLFVYQSYNPIDEYYGLPHYVGAIQAIQAEIRMKNYDLNSIMNNFTPSGFITLNQVNDDNEREMILRNIEAMFKGDDNANNLIVTFRNSNDDKPIEYSPIASNYEGVNLFADNNERTINRIISSHRIASKALIGLPMDSTGFSNEGTLLETAYNLTNKLIVNNLRQVVTKTVNQLLNMNGIDQNIILKPMSFILEINSNEEQTAYKQIGFNN